MAVRSLTAGGALVEVGRPEQSPVHRPTAGLVLVLLAALLFLAHGSRTISAPFGDSHDGRNAGVWALGSQSLRQSGPIDSRLGTRSPQNSVYVNHPPLIYLKTAVAELVGPAVTATTRAPAWLGSLLAMLLLARLLRERGLLSGAVGTAVLLVATTPMFLVYGTMLDTPITSLPIGIGLLLVWERARRGEPVRPLSAAGLAALAVLAGWQALILAFIIAGWAGGRALRGTGRRLLNMAFAGGALVGGGTLLGWLLWSLGGTLSPLFDQFRLRTGQTIHDVSLGTLLTVQRNYSMAMFGAVGLLGLGGLVLALRDVRTRGLAAVALAVTLPYSFVFKSGAVNHDYWNYWFLLPLAIGVAVGSDRLLAGWASSGRPVLAPLLVVALTGCLLTAALWSQQGVAEQRKINGFEAAEAVRGRALVSDQQRAWYAGAVGEPAAWLALATGRPAVRVPGTEYAQLAGLAPGEVVLVGELHCVAGTPVRSYELRPAASLVDRPPAIERC